MPGIVNGLVSILLGGGGGGGEEEEEEEEDKTEEDNVPSDLLLMVTSCILESILCSSYDTTKPEHFAGLVQVLSK
eukprot:5858330-Ditylum_brightwellii.AAC.1